MKRRRRRKWAIIEGIFWLKTLLMEMEEAE
jgi:hypothetical protein